MGEICYENLGTFKDGVNRVKGYALIKERRNQFSVVNLRAKNDSGSGAIAQFINYNYILSELLRLEKTLADDRDKKEVIAMRLSALNFAKCDMPPSSVPEICEIFEKIVKFNSKV